MIPSTVGYHRHSLAVRQKRQAFLKLSATYAKPEAARPTNCPYQYNTSISPFRQQRAKERHNPWPSPSSYPFKSSDRVPSSLLACQKPQLFAVRRHFVRSSCSTPEWGGSPTGTIVHLAGVFRSSLRLGLPLLNTDLVLPRQTLP